MTISITTMHHYRRVWAALSATHGLTVGELQTLTQLSRPTIRDALWYLRACRYADCRAGEGWLALIPPSHAV